MLQQKILPRLVVKERAVVFNIQKLRNLITKHGARYLQVDKGYGRDNALLIFDSGLREEAKCNNYGGIMAIDCLAHELEFRAVIHDEIGGTNQYIRMDKSELPLINLVCLNLVTGSQGNTGLFVLTPLC